MRGVIIPDKFDWSRPVIPCRELISLGNGAEVLRLRMNLPLSRKSSDPRLSEFDFREGTKLATRNILDALYLILDKIEASEDVDNLQDIQTEVFRMTLYLAVINEGLKDRIGGVRK